jgi:hypothetical protein
MEMAAQGTVAPEEISRLAKHADAYQRLPDQTVRYATNKVQLAIALGSGKVTSLL